MARPVSRRRFCGLLIGTGALALFSACGGPPPPEALTPSPTPAPAKPGEPAQPTPTPAMGAAPKVGAPTPTPTPEPPQLVTEVPPLAKEAEGKTYTAVPSLTYKGEIVFYAQAYTPVTPTATRPKPPRYLNRIIAEYEKLHPGIKIKLVPPAQIQGDYTTWLRTQIAGGQAPDIFWHHWSFVNNDLPKGTVVDLRPWMEKPNPYISSGPGSQKWIDLFTDHVIEQIRAPDGAIYQVNGDIVSTNFYYNKDLFMKAGLDPEKPPKTWEEFIQAQESLKSKGIVPTLMTVGPKDYRWSWWQRDAGTMLFVHRFEELSVDGAKYQLSQLAQAVSFKKGILHPDNPAYQEVWRIFKDWSKYWPEGFLADYDFYRDWARGEVAIMWNGSWAAPAALNDPLISFKWGTFRMPKFTKQTTPHATEVDPPAWGAGGPNAAFQFSVTTQRANRTMTPEKIEAAVDFLRFLTVPWNAGPMVNDLGAFIPTIKGTKTEGPLVQVAQGIDVPSKVVAIAAELDTEQSEAYKRALQDFLAGKVTLKEFMEKAKTLTEEAVRRVARKNNWDLSKYGVSL